MHEERGGTEHMEIVKTESLSCQRFAWRRRRRMPLYVVEPNEGGISRKDLTSSRALELMSLKRLRL